MKLLLFLYTIQKNILYTEARKMNAGWLWRIPTFGRWGNGYVYNNNLITKDQVAEVEKQYE